MRPLGLTDREQADLVAFLNALTGSQRKMALKREGRTAANYRKLATMWSMNSRVLAGTKWRDG